MRLSSGHVHANRPRCRNGQDTRGVYGWFQQPSSDETASKARRTQRTAVAQAYGVQEGEGVRASGGPEADLVAAVAPHLALRAVALALRAHILAERDVVERALRLDLGLHAVRHALVEGALEPALALLDLVELDGESRETVRTATSTSTSCTGTSNGFSTRTIYFGNSGHTKFTQTPVAGLKPKAPPLKQW